MAATVLTINTVAPNGILDVDAVDQAFNAADGADFANDGRTRILIKNSGAGAHVITVTTPKTVAGGLAIADKTFSVGAAKYAILPYFDPIYFNSNGLVHMVADGTQTEVTALAMRES